MYVSNHWYEVIPPSPFRFVIDIRLISHLSTFHILGDLLEFAPSSQVATFADFSLCSEVCSEVVWDVIYHMQLAFQDVLSWTSIASWRAIQIKGGEQVHTPLSPDAFKRLYQVLLWEEDIEVVLSFCYLFFKQLVIKVFAEAPYKKYYFTVNLGNLYVPTLASMCVHICTSTYPPPLTISN